MRIVFAVGLTGGHIYPALAMAEELHHRADILFVVRTKSPLSGRLLKKDHYPVLELDVIGLPRRLKNFWQAPVFIWRQWKAFWLCWKALRDWRPAVAVGMGSYVSFPVMLAARLMGAKTLIYEPNAVFGLVNRVLAPLVDRVAVTMNQGNLGRRMITVGAPMRRQLIQAKMRQPGKIRAALGIQEFWPCVLVVGGSQGAGVINEVMKRVFEHLKILGIEFSFIHITGAADHAGAVAYYEKRGLLGLGGICLEYGHDMGSLYQAASLVIARAGALTCLELLFFARRAFLIPLPSSAESHQLKNAQFLERSGIAKIIDEHPGFEREIEESLRGEIGRSSFDISFRPESPRPTLTQSLEDLLGMPREKK
ncbi:MAG: UDP-N-acetylglucosamine--N-acetylmuramyl-(pentapeptide) pyrophosphoryl-undecaprenol N-acetylglucosamine transferase [Elusimicrobia bacterium]|nr:UDP-N-acetylglucosamine--N-acetylmuramyl-(pentapeptide) pyrophosphoryl-undecaprenol N-acetylglucosamine transferase [Elusimicrobiota bacterium]